MTDQETFDDVDFDAIFRRGGKQYASREDRDRRVAAERRASLTAKQRERMTAPKKLVNFRASEETRALIKRLGDHFDEGTTAVIHRALERLAAGVPDMAGSK